MAIEIKAELVEKINKAYFAWFTTVRADGMPQPTPVWFIPENGTYLMYSVPNQQKLRNIAANPKVALSISHDVEGEDWITIMGEAVVVPDFPLPHQNPAYVAKYEGGIRRLGWTPEQMGTRFSVAIRITPLQIRGE